MNNPSTPVNISELRKALEKHQNRCFVNYLFTVLIQGFLAGLSFLPKVSHVCNNIQSALKEPETADKLLATEVEKGYMIGPYDSPPFSTFRINPIGIAMRKYSEKIMIDLSAPHDDSAPSLNSLLPLAHIISLFYATVDNAIQFIKLAWKGAWLGKADITDAFKVMLLHPSQAPFWCQMAK